jgi:hypothetical protein
MKREAGIAFELLERHDAAHEEKIDICEEIRKATLELFWIIRKYFLLELYLYIVVFLIVRVFPAYYTPVHVLYIVAFGPYGIQLVYS